jgi:hypothetical protein
MSDLDTESRRLITQQSIDASNQSYASPAYADLGGIHSVLREIRGELGQIRTRLDSLVAIEGQLRYQGGRLGAVEKRLTRLVETKLKAPESAPALDTARSCGARPP